MKSIFGIKRQEPPPPSFREELTAAIERAVASGTDLRWIAEQLENAAERARVRWATSAPIM